MNSQKQETKPPDREDGDHAQPINLAASRPSASPSTSVAVTFSGMTVPVATQPVSSRSHMETPKPGQMTLYFCTPSTSRPSGTSHIMSPIMSGEVSSAQHFSAKQVSTLKKFKVGYCPPDKAGDKTTVGSSSEVNIKFIRMQPNDSSQSHGGSTVATQPAAVMTPGILPNALGGGAGRHIVPAAVHPVIPSGGSMQGPMASIIKSGTTGSSSVTGGSSIGSGSAVTVGSGQATGGTTAAVAAHQVSQVGHVIHQHYSSHVPRGPAAVASISAGPKSAVATPILRAPNSSGTMTLASSMISPHTPVRARSPTLVTGKTTPIASTVAHPQVIDLQKSSIGHTLSNQSQLNLTSRSVDIGTSSIRTGISHAPSITIAKTINISQPIVQHLQQVSDKGYLKPISGATAVTSAPSNTTLAHQGGVGALTSSQSSSNEIQNVCVVPTVTRATISNISTSGAYAAGIVQIPAQSAIPQHVPTLRPSLVQPQALHTLTSSVSMTTTQATSRQAFTVISAKTLPSGNQSVTLATPLSRASASAAATSCVTVSKSGQPLSATSTRILTAPNSSAQTAVPIAKVYPQPLPASSQVTTEPSAGESGRVVQQAQSASAPQTANTGKVSTAVVVTSVCSVTTSAATAAVTSVSSPPVLFSEKRSESATAVRFTSLTKQTAGGGGTAFGLPSATYLCDQYPGTLSVHPYSAPSSNQSFTATIPTGQLRPLALSQHGTGGGATAGAHAASVCVPASSTAAAAPVQPLNSLMVAVDSRHVTLPYNRVTIGGAKTIAELVPHPVTTSSSQNVSAAAANLIAISQAPASHIATSQSQGSVSNHLSPRPSILRKRTTENVSSSIAKRNLMTSLTASEQVSPNLEYTSGMNMSTAPSPKAANGHVRENGISLMAPDTEQMTLGSPAPLIRKESDALEKSSCVEGNDAAKDSRPTEASPRKKPRKQLLAANELIETHSSEGEENFDREVKDTAKEVRTDDEHVRWVTFCKRPAMSLLSNYRHTWKSRHNHFLRYSDVKPKEEKPPSVNELVNQKGIVEEVNGWKIYHLTGQMEDLSVYEESVYARLSHWLDLEDKSNPVLFGKSSSSEDVKIINKLTDLVKGNLQRSKIAQEQAIESQQQIVKIIDHKPNILEIVNKYISRRPLKKKEKT